MPAVQTKVFRRLTASSDNELCEALEGVALEVNAFLAQLPNLGDALDIQYGIQPLDAQRVLCSAIVVFVEV